MISYFCNKIMTMVAM